ncbi:hypothetical protein [Acidithrix sp. C25]|uniref:hypothetical protein n=1 Tax=Acidithrix sp. C25 TaxID=1671482 RepID=UPI00191BA34D|nr:hypothetical protein [Acidithrix sp. C25]
MYANATASFDSSNPHSAVTRIIEAISDSHTDALVRLTDSKRAHQLTGRSSPRPEELRKVLHNSLIDVLSLATWSLATAPRLPAPDTEIVKWVRTGPTVEVVREPHLVTANTFLFGLSSSDALSMDGSPSSLMTPTLPLRAGNL